MSEQQTQNAKLQSASLNPGGYSDPRAAFSPKVKEFKDAMGLLYIRNNASGRNKFRLKWGEVAQFIFGDELIRMDNEGTQDRELRAKLENEAGLRRIALKVVLDEYEEKSVKAGMLDFEYVGRILDKLGVNIGKLLYAEDIIDRVRPGMISKNTQENADKTQADYESQERADDAIRARSALSAQEGESFDLQFTQAELAEKALADQERMALRPVAQENPLAGLHEEMLKSSQFTSMKIEISDEIRPIETQPLEPVSMEEVVSLPQDLDAYNTTVQIQETVVIQETIANVQVSVEAYIESSQHSVADALQSQVVQPEPVAVAAVAAPVLPPFETEKKPRLHIAGLRIKDELKEDVPAVQVVQPATENAIQD